MPRETGKVTYEIREHLGVIGRKNSGWQKELNLVCWNGKEPPKYDIRDWDRNHEHMSKGITLYEDEMKTLFRLLLKYNNKRVVEEARKNGVADDSDDWEVLSDEGISDADEEILSDPDFVPHGGNGINAGESGAVPF